MSETYNITLDSQLGERGGTLTLDGSGRSVSGIISLLGFAIVILILLCSYFWPGGVQPGGVVLCIVLFSTPVDSYIPYALNRILDTSVGVIVALAVNYFGYGGQ